MDRQNTANATSSETQRQPGVLQNLQQTPTGVTVRTQAALNGIGTGTQQGVAAPH